MTHAWLIGLCIGTIFAVVRLWKPIRQYRAVKRDVKSWEKWSK